MFTVNGAHPRGTQPRAATDLDRAPRRKERRKAFSTMRLPEDEAVLLNATELRVKASHMRERADQQSDAGAADAYRLMAEHYEAVAMLQEDEKVTPSYG
jgi:hypothetical protein